MKLIEGFLICKMILTTLSTDLNDKNQGSDKKLNNQIERTKGLQTSFHRITKQKLKKQRKDKLNIDSLLQKKMRK